METFILVYFWIGAFGLVVNVLVVGFSEFPRVETQSLGFYVAKVMVGAPFVLWAAYLLWS